MSFSGKLLVGVDESPAASDALALASQLAARTGANLVLANVIAGWPASHHGGEEVGESRRAEAQRLLDRAASDLGGEIGFETQLGVSKSDAKGLIDLGEQIGAGAIVVGSSHRGAIGGVLIGSVGERLLHGAGRPVLVAPRHYKNHERPLKRVGVAYDGSDESEHALATAVELARAARADLSLLAVSDPAAFVEPLTPDMLDVSDPIGAQRIHEGALGRMLEDAASKIDAPPDVSHEILTGSPAEELARAGSGEDALDMIVCGSRGHGPVGVVLLGSVSAKLVRTAQCPMMVVPRG